MPATWRASHQWSLSPHCAHSLTVIYLSNGDWLLLGGGWVCLPAGNAWEDGGRWLTAALALCENEPINSVSPQASLCLLSLFVSEMIPSVTSKGTLSYSCCRGNRAAARERARISLSRLKRVNMKGYLWRFMRNGNMTDTFFPCVSFLYCNSSACFLKWYNIKYLGWDVSLSDQWNLGTVSESCEAFRQLIPSKLGLFKIFNWPALQIIQSKKGVRIKHFFFHLTEMSSCVNCCVITVLCAIKTVNPAVKTLGDSSI